MIKLDNVTKTFGTGTSGLEEITLSIDRGEFVFLTGQSGSGKTTLLRLLIRDTLPTRGTIIVNDWDVTKLPQSKVPHLRRKIGVVFQDLKMLMDRTIAENILLPLEVSGTDHKTAQLRMDEILGLVGISEQKHKFPVQLSGGELQRAAIARALVFSPDILLADEPTGNLDTATSWEILKLLQDINKSGTTIVMATHNTDIVNSLLKRVIALDKGRLIKDDKREGSKGTKEEKKETASNAADAEETKESKGTEEKSEHKEKEHEKKHVEHKEKEHEQKDKDADKSFDKAQDKKEEK
jgi:cell division transport system ATP-binding protein